MRKRVVTYEMVKTVHIIEVPVDFIVNELDDYAHLIAEQDSQPVEILDAQIYEVLSADDIPVN